MHYPIITVSLQLEEYFNVQQKQDTFIAQIRPEFQDASDLKSQKILNGKGK